MGQPIDDAAERAGMVVDPGSRTGIAEGEHGGVLRFSQMDGQWLHRSAAFAEAVQQDHRRPTHLGNRSLVCQLGKGFEACRVGAFEN